MKYNLSSFTLEEKCRLVAGKDFWHTEDLDGKVYSVKVSDGPLGLRTSTNLVGFGGDYIPATAFRRGRCFHRLGSLLWHTVWEKCWLTSVSSVT